MGFSNEDKILLKKLYDSKWYQESGAKKTNEFPEKGWSKSGLPCSVVSTRDKSILRMS